MANDTKQNRRRRRSGGISTPLMILLLVIAIGLGGMIGFAVARRTVPKDTRLEQANERIIELENTLNLIGFPMDGDPENWVFDDSDESNAADELAGRTAEDGDGESDLWSEDEGLLTGMLSDDGDPVVVAEFDGGQLLSTEVIPAYNDELTTQIFAGFSAEEVSGSVLQQVLTRLAGEKIIALKAKELGLDEVTDADRQQIQAEADRIFQEDVDYYAAFVAREGMSQAEIEAAAKAYMAGNEGITRESIVEQLTRDLPVTRFRAHISEGITISDEELKQVYQERLETQKSSFNEFPEEYEYAHLEGETLLYNPEGYRAVKNLLLSFPDEEASDQAAALVEQISHLDYDADGDRIRELEAQLDPLYQTLETRANEILEKLRAGESFDALLDQYGQDLEMKTEPLRTQGYYISDHSFLFSHEFIEGSMILEEPGQVSAPLRSGAGLHLVQYAADVPAGEVPFDQVADALRQELLKEREETHYEQQLSDLLDQANVQYYPERLQ